MISPEDFHRELIEKTASVVTTREKTVEEINLHLDIYHTSIDNLRRTGFPEEKIFEGDCELLRRIEYDFYHPKEGMA
ncbi:hypothetical protein J4229_02160 [Candidatus Pacearchaeota archaeon]|nr:hypothetical protein [Candidatus Pacearchaeota archaeon]